MSKKSLYMTVTLVTLLLSVAACKSTPEIGETQTLDTSASEQTELSDAADTLSEPTPEPEAPFQEMSEGGDVAQNDHTYIPPEPSAPSAPVESLGASSSGLGR